MSNYSNVTKEEMAEILDNFRRTQQVVIPEHVKIAPLPPAVPQKCKYAEDTGEIAFLRAPCRGNKIICHRIEGHVSYTKSCTSNLCKFYEPDLK